MTHAEWAKKRGVVDALALIMPKEHLDKIFGCEKDQWLTVAVSLKICCGSKMGKALFAAPYEQVNFEIIRGIVRTETLKLLAKTEVIVYADVNACVDDCVAAVSADLRVGGLSHSTVRKVVNTNTPPRQTQG